MGLDRGYSVYMGLGGVLQGLYGVGEVCGLGRGSCGGSIGLGWSIWGKVSLWS